MEARDSLWRGFCTAYSFQKVMNHIVENHAHDIDFIISTGDIAFNGNDKMYACMAELLGLRPGSEFPGPQLLGIKGLEGIPIYLMPGNHDRPDALVRGLFPGSPVPETLDFAFTHKGVRFVCVDSTFAYGGESLTKASMNLIRENVSEDDPSVLLMHLNPTPIPGFLFMDSHVPANMNEVWSILRGKNVPALLFAHIHSNYEAKVEGIRLLSLAGTAFQISAWDSKVFITLENLYYRVFTFDDGELTHETIQIDMGWGSVFEQ